MARSYGYTVARLKAMENRLLDGSDFARLADSPTLEAALKTLTETGYGAAFAELKNPLAFDSAIDSHLADTYAELKTFVPDEELIVLSRLLYDIHNAKTVLKGRVLANRGGSRRLDLLTPLGNMDTDALTLALEGDEFSLMSWGLGEGLRRAYEALESGDDFKVFEREVDRLYYTRLVELARELDQPLVTQWAQARIDGDNLKTLLRLSRHADMDVKVYLAPGGILSPATLQGLVGEPVENWNRVLSTTDWAALLAPFAEGGDFGAKLGAFERELDDYLTALLDPARYDPFGPANVTRYLWAKEMEVKNLRLILVSLANGVEKERIREVLRRVG